MSYIVATINWAGGGPADFTGTGGGHIDDDAKGVRTELNGTAIILSGTQLSSEFLIHLLHVVVGWTRHGVE